jgi:methionyl-tRNA formyltransferase
MKLVFMGTPDFALATLKALMAAGHDIVAVYSQPPRPAGRGQKLKPSPVQAFAECHGLPVATPLSLKLPEEQAKFQALGADAAVVVAYGLILPRAILDAPRLGCFNVHASLLPRWRGAAPIQRAIMSGDAETGVAIMQMEAGLDTGPVCAMARMAITPEHTAGSLHDELASFGASLMVKVLAEQTITHTPQPAEGVTYAAKIDKAEAHIDFARHAADVRNHIHGLSPFPGAWFSLNGARIKVLRCAVVEGHGAAGTVLDAQLTVACAERAVRLTLLQREGKEAMDAATFLRGFAIPAGTRLS